MARVGAIRRLLLGTPTHQVPFDQISVLYVAQRRRELAERRAALGDRSRQL